VLDELLDRRKGLFTVVPFARDGRRGLDAKRGRGGRGGIGGRRSVEGMGRRAKAGGCCRDGSVLLLLKGSGVEVVRLVLGRRSVLRRAGRNGKQRGEELVVGSFAVVLVDVGRLGAKCQRRSGREGKGRKSSVEEGVEGSRRPRRLVGGSVGGGEIGRSWVDVRIGRFRWGETR
jgi:hypothetical protein